MNWIVLAFNAVFPLLAFMAIGYFLAYIKLFKKSTADGMNALVFKVFLPLSIIQSIYNADVKNSFDVRLAVFVAVSCILAYIVISLIINAREKDKTIAPVMIQGIHKANYNLLAIPIIQSFFGSEIGMAAVLVVVITPIVNICSTLAFESARASSADGGENTGRPQMDMRSIWKLVKKILLNPMVSSALIGLLLNLSGIKIPTLIMNSVVSKLAAMSTPAAMLALGCGFNFKQMKNWVRHLAIVSTGKLLILPLINVTAAVLLGIRGANLIAVLLFSGAPAAVNSYSTAVSMGGNEELAGEIVAVTSLLSVFTLFGFLSILGTMGYL
ncbi:MAG: AEC family transporter [Firmicutes bacterium]|nr:AEC family transporter [Bacillota bacterium]